MRSTLFARKERYGTRSHLRLRTLLPLCLALTTTTCKEGVAPTVDELVQMVIDFCDSNTPQLVAVQSAAGGAWVPVTGNANGTFTVSVPESFGFVAVYEGGEFFEAEVLYASREDFAFLDGDTCEEEPARDRSISGSVPGLSASQAADISIFDAFTFVFGGGATAFQIDGLPSQPLDLVATRFGQGDIDRIILRRNLSATATSTPALDFSAAEAMTPATNTLTFTGGGTDFIGLDRVFRSSLGTVHPLSALETGPTTATFTSVPTAQTVDGDMHELIVSGVNTTGDAVRSVRTFFRAGGDLTSALGPHLPAPSVSSSGTPARPRVQVTSQLEYGGTVVAFVTQGFKSVGLTKTAGYDGATPAVWDMEFPNLSGVTGFPGGGLTSGGSMDWIVLASNAPISFFFADVATEGQIVKAGSRASFTSATYGNRPAVRLLRNHRRGAPRGW